jgi:hypothetical protein
MTPDEIEAAVFEGAADRVIVLVRAAPEADRRAAGSRMLALQKQLGGFKAYVAEWQKPGRERGRASLLALLGTGSAAQIRAGDSGGWIRHVAGTAEVLSCRPPELLTELAAWLIERVGWECVRKLVRDGAMPRPVCDEYYLGMLNYFIDCRALVRDDPELLEHEAWRLFEIEGTQQLSLADHDKYSGYTWADIFLGLAAADPAKRARLLDSSLAALERDFPAFKAGWFSRFHEALKPTVDERSERVSSYLRLLRSPIPATVSMAVAALGEIQKAGRLGGAELLSHVSPALQARAAGTAKLALRMVDGAARGDPALAGRAGVVAADALAHPAADVQAAALAILERVAQAPDPELGAALERRRDDMAASLRPRFEELAGHFSTRPTIEPIEPAEPIEPIEPAARAQHAVDPFASLTPIRPIETLPELVEAVAHVYETAGPPDEIERVLDGIARLSDQRPPDFDRLVRPIRHRADRIQARRHERTRAKWGSYSDNEVAVNLATLVTAWVDGVEPELKSDWPVTLGRFIVGRIAEVAHWAVGRTGEPMLAAPTHSGGWIEPVALVDRLAERLRAGRTDEAWYRHDLVQAMLRLLPWGRDTALIAARHLPGESALALRYALGDDVEIGPTCALWVAAARCRNPDGGDPALRRAHEGLGSGAAEAGTFTISMGAGRFRLLWPVLAVDPPVGYLGTDLPTVLLSALDCHSYTEPEGKALVDWLRFVWPQNRRSWFGSAAVLLARNMEWDEAQWPNRLRLEPLFEPWTEIGREAALLLAVALQAKEPGERGMATEAAAVLLADGRLKPQAIETAIAELADLMAAQPASKWPHRLLRPPRFATSLEQVASASRAHALAAQEIAALTLESFATPRGPVFVPVGQLAPLLRLMIELAAQTGSPTPPMARPSLERLAVGKCDTGKLARQLLLGS